MAIVIDSIDKKILGFLTENARTAFTDIAKACGVSGAAIHQRVNKLEESGVLKGSCCLVDEKILGYTTLPILACILKKVAYIKAFSTESRKYPKWLNVTTLRGNMVFC